MLKIRFKKEIKVYFANYLLVFLSFCLTVFLSYCLFVLLSFCPAIFLSYCLSVLLSLCPAAFLSYCLSVHLYFCPKSVCPTVFLSLYISVCLCYCPSTVFLPNIFLSKIFLSHCLSVFLYFCLFIFLSVFLSFALLYFCSIVSLSNSLFCLSVFLSFCLCVKSYLFGTLTGSGLWLRLDEWWESCSWSMSIFKASVLSCKSSSSLARISSRFASLSQASSHLFWKFSFWKTLQFWVWNFIIQMYSSTLNLIATKSKIIVIFLYLKPF